MGREEQWERGIVATERERAAEGKQAEECVAWVGVRTCSPSACGRCVLGAGQSKINVKLNDGKGIVTVDLKKVKELYTVNPKTKCASCSVPPAPTATACAPTQTTDPSARGAATMT